MYCMFSRVFIYVLAWSIYTLLLAPVSSSTFAWRQQVHDSLSYRKICARLTSCHCTPLFLTSILLCAFSPSIIHGWEQTFVFCLNNWLKAWARESERASAWVKNRKKEKKRRNEKSLRAALSPLSFVFAHTLRWWLNISFLPSLFFSLTSHLSKVDLASASDRFSPSFFCPFNTSFSNAKKKCRLYLLHLKFMFGSSVLSMTEISNWATYIRDWEKTNGWESLGTCNSHREERLARDDQICRWCNSEYMWSVLNFLHSPDLMHLVFYQPQSIHL